MTASDKQLWRINTLEEVSDIIAPSAVRRSGALASAWIAVSYATLTDTQLSEIKRPLQTPPSFSEVLVPATTLAEALGVGLPSAMTVSALRRWLGELRSAVPVPESDKIFRYWLRALRYRDLNELIEKPQVSDPVDVSSLHEKLPKILPTFKVPRNSEPGDAVALLLAYTPEQGKRKASAFLGIPLAYDKKRGILVPPGGSAPFFSREWLEPPDPDAEKESYLGTVLDCDDFFSENPMPGDALWPGYWEYISTFVSTITGAEDALPDLAPIVRRKDTAWKIVEWDSGAATKRIADTYKAALEEKQAPLLTRITGNWTTPQVFGVADALMYGDDLIGHIDTFDKKKGKRTGFGLESSQRIAATAMTRVIDGELLTVNGPPGTGKTSFLRSVIGTMSVNAALDGGSAPLILATAATNKAVTNIIESFSEVPGPEMKPEWQSRWLPNLPSYGWFFPARTKPDEECGGYMVLRLEFSGPGSPPELVMSSAATKFSEDQEQKRAWLLQDFLELHRQALGLSKSVSSAEEAAKLIRGRLSESIESMRLLRKRLSSCLDISVASPAFELSEDNWRQQARSLRARESELQASIQSAAETLRNWSKCSAGFRQADNLRARRTGWLYAIKKFFLGDRLEFAAMDEESEALDLATRLDSTFCLHDKTHLSAAEQRQSNTALFVKNAKKQLASTQQELASVMPMLHQWATWRSDINEIAKALGDERDNFQDVVDAWEQSGFDNDADVRLSFEEALDKKFRFLHFHMAARYWEARWLADVPAPKDVGDTNLALKRAAMLAPVIVSTVYTLPSISRDFEFADLLIFDESGQASSEIGAASLAYAKRAIVVGDIHQLKPVWNVGREADVHLCTDLEIGEMPEALSASKGSIMKMAQKITAFTTDGNPTLGQGIELVAHYRCRSDIIEYCRRLVYKTGLKPCREEEPPNGNADFIYPPMAWVAVSSHEAAQKQDGSWVNRDQIQEIVRWLRHDRGRLLAHYGKNRLADVVALIAPFRAQANALRSAVASELGNDEAEGMVINTVHALQGAEKPIVAFSLTQDEANFFVDRDGPNLLNVAVSRAKDSFILFAAPSVLHPHMDHKTARKARNEDEKKPLTVLVEYMNEKGKRLYPREVVIIEAPGKEARVEDALGLSAKIVSTGGHFRRVVDRGGRLEPEITNKETAELLKMVAEDKNHIDAFYLATDDDDDGEEIAWHVEELLLQSGVDRNYVRRMRFYSLAPDDIRRAREQALPGIDASRVRANLFRGLFDAALHEQLRKSGVNASRPQLALLHELRVRAKVQPKWALKVKGRIGEQQVSGFLLNSAGQELANYSELNAAVAAAELLSSGLEACLHDVQTNRVRLPRYPAGTTAQTLVAGCRRYDWDPKRTMDALKDLYLGHSKSQAYGVGGKANPDAAGGANQ